MTITKCKRKHGTVYVVREDLGRTPDGRRDRRQVTCTTLREARDAQAELITKRKAMRGKSGRISLEEYVERWYRPLMRQFAASTRDTYERELRLRVLPNLGSMCLCDIDRMAVQEMVDSCETLAPAVKAIGVLRTILEEALCDGLVETNVAKLRYCLPPEGKKRDNGLVIGSFAQMKPIFDAIALYDDDGTVAKLAATGLLLGLRPQERYGLDWEDFDFKAHTVRIERAYLMVSRAEGVHDLKDPKSQRGRRQIPLPGPAQEMIEPLRAKGETGPFLKGLDGERLSPSTGRHRWKTFLAWCDESGLEVPQVTLENMRHSFATSFLEAGGNVENLSRILGHANISTTLHRYVRPSMDNLTADMQRVQVEV